ncbi:hypothetical protein FA15DRAFT_575001, partial [Coprinopsis marcescibilis]
IPKENIPEPSKSLADTLNITPTSENEALLLAALQDLAKKHHALTDRVAALQAGQILNEAYCGKLRKRLALKEATKKPNPGAGRILGDGLPHMLTGDAFVDQVRKSAEAQKEKEAEAD